MKKDLISLFVALLCCLFVGAQPLVKQVPPRRNHHTHRLPGVNERRLVRLEKMREANIARRHREGPWRAKTQPETQRGLVLLVEFPDVKMKAGASTQWNNRFNQQGFSLDRHVGSVRDYFIDQSYGLLTVDFDVVGPLELSREHDYYGTAPNSDLDDRAAELVIEALNLADSLVNYADYDWDRNSWVDQVYIIYAGITSDTETGYIWPHEWDLASAEYYGSGSGYQRLDGVYINTYAVSNELANAVTLEGIGTACHEFSHCLGYPDFYDTEYSGGTAGQNWDVLDGGSYNGPWKIGEIPSPYTAYERWIAGWIDLIPLTEACKVKDMPAINEEGVAYIINNSGNSNEYYILENRQKITFGTGNGGHGLMVWHIDYNRLKWNQNAVNSEKDHQRMTFLPADGSVGRLVETYYGYAYEISSDDEEGDPYPGKQNVTEVPQLTWFTAEKYGTKVHQNRIHDISENSNGKITFIYGDYYALPTPEVTSPTDISEDSFTANWQPVEGATSYTLEVEALTGELSPSTVLAEDFSRFVDLSKDSRIGSSVIDSYTQTGGWYVSNVYGTKDASIRLGSSNNIGQIMTPVIDNRAGTLIAEFDASYYNSDGSSIVVSVLKNSETIATKTIQLTSSRATYTCTFENAPNGCNVKFETMAQGRRLYLYNVNIMDLDNSGSTSVTFTGITTTSYTIEGIDADMYCYRVQAICDDGYSNWSEWMDVDIAAPIKGICENAEIKGVIYDLSGRRLRRIPQRGIYIQGSKTYMAR